MGAARSLNLRIRIHPSLILWLSLLYYLRPGDTLAFLAAAGIHELGHGIALWCLDKPPRELMLSALGAKLDTPVLGYRESIAALAAGPLASLLFGLYFPLFPRAARLSAALFLFNLLPLPGLDGGGILKNVLSLAVGPERSLRLCRAIAWGLCALLGALCLAVMLCFHIVWWPAATAILLLLKAWDAWQL